MTAGGVDAGKEVRGKTDYVPGEALEQRGSASPGIWSSRRLLCDAGAIGPRRKALTRSCVVCGVARPRQREGFGGAIRRNSSKKSSMNVTWFCGSDWSSAGGATATRIPSGCNA